MICPKQIGRFRTGNLLLYEFLKYMALRDLGLLHSFLMMKTQVIEGTTRNDMR
jgi:hypothetical protein